MIIAITLSLKASRRPAPRSTGVTGLPSSLMAPTRIGNPSSASCRMWFDAEHGVCAIHHSADDPASS